MIPTLFGVLILTFLFPRMLTGDPTLAMFPIDIEPEIREAAMEELGLNDPWYTQLFIYLKMLKAT